MRRGKREATFPDNGFEAWGGYMNAKIAKLEDQFKDKAESEENKKSNIFSGISIFVNGYTKPSANELKCLMSEHGGTYHHYFRSKITSFIIASNLPDTKVKSLPTTKILKPEWVTDSINAGIILDYKDYLLYGNFSRNQPRLNFKNTSTTISKENNVLKIDDAESVEEKENNDIDNLQIQKNSDIDTRETIRKEGTKDLFLKNNLIVPNDGNASNVTRTAVDHKFLSEFYNNSRLHHISQLGAAFKHYVNELRSTSNQEFPMRETLKKIENDLKNSQDDREVDCSPTDKVIMHIDMDCFFVSVGLRNRPHLRGLPVAVTHAKNVSDNGRPREKRPGVNRQAEFDMYRKRREKNVKKGSQILDCEENEEISSRIDGISDENEKYGSMSEIASCSYEARALGLHNGMFMGPALKLCPNLKTIPYDFEGYQEVARSLYDTVAQFTLDIEAVSCDEMYVDCTELLKDINLSPMEFASTVRQEIKAKTGCPCSTGFGGNRVQARLATKKAKPDGQFYMEKHQVEEYFSNVSLSDLPGVGRQMQYKLKSLGYTTCESLRSTELSKLQKHFGYKTGKLLYDYSRGRDDRPLHFIAIRKSISVGVNYGIRFEDNSQCETFLKQLSEEVCSRMSKISVVSKSITFKLMVRAADAPIETAKFMGHGICDNITKTINLSKATDDVHVITKEVLEICRKLDVRPDHMRGISIQLSKLENKEQKKRGIETFFGSKATVENVTKHMRTRSFKNTDDSKRLNVKPSPIIDYKKDGREDLEISTKTHESNVKVMKDVVVNREKNSVPFDKSKKSLGLVGKRRGRPPKHLAVAKPLKVSEKNRSMNVYLRSQIKEKVSPVTSTAQYNLKDLDLEFLDALPSDIKAEILANCKPETTSNSTSPMKSDPSKSLEIDPNTLHLIETQSRDPVILDNNTKQGHIEDTKTARKNNDGQSSVKTNQNLEFFDLPWKDMREMLRLWFESNSAPIDCDLKEINLYMQNLVVMRKICDLSPLLSFLHRHIEEKQGCEWHSAYREIVAGIQKTMIVVYGKKIYTHYSFPCCDLY